MGCPFCLRNPTTSGAGVVSGYGLRPNPTYSMRCRQNNSFFTASFAFSSSGVPRAAPSRLPTPVPGGFSA